MRIDVPVLGRPASCLAAALGGLAAVGACTTATPGALAKPATQATKRPCDRRGGATIQANPHLRLYRKARADLDGARYEARVCMYRSRRDVSLGYDGLGARYLDSTYAIYGKFAVMVLLESPPPTITNRTPGVTRNVEVMWDGRRERFLPIPGAPTTGLKFSQVVISPTGLIARLGQPHGLTLPPEGQEGQFKPRTDAVIEVLDPSVPDTPTTYNSWHTVATGPAGTLTDLVATRTRLVWSTGGQLASAPFALPVDTAGMPSGGKPLTGQH